MSLRSTTIVIGSSPLCLTEAWVRAKSGEQVTILEKSSSLGGAWSSIEFAGFKDVECGCHLPTPDQNVYKFIRTRLGWNLAPLSPPPRTIIGKRVFPYDAIHVPAFFFREKLRTSLDIRSSKDVRDWFYNMKKVARRFNESRNMRTLTTLYPRGGCPEMITKLQHLLDEASVTIERNTTVIDIKKNRDGVEVRTPKEVLYANELVVTSGTSLPMLPKSTRRFPNIHITIHDSSPKQFSALRILGHKTLHRINDITEYASEGSDTIKILTLFSPESIEDTFDERAVADEAVHILKKHNFISQDATIHSVQKNDYRVPAHSMRVLHEFSRKFQPYVQTLYSTELTRSFAANLSRWEQMLIQAKKG